MTDLEQTYQDWRSSLKKPDDSVFYYHRSLDRIMLSLAMFVISTKPLLSKLGKAEMLGILHLQVPDLITAWIDEDSENFKTLFPLVMTVSEAYIPSAMSLEKENPSKKKAIRNMAYMFTNACGWSGDMNDELAEELLDDLTTDGREIHSDKIKKYGEQFLFLTQRYGLDIPMAKLVTITLR